MNLKIVWPNWRWRVLDMFDWYSPKYQSKHTHWEVFDWFQGEGLVNIKIGEGEVTLLGEKPLDTTHNIS